MINEAELRAAFARTGDGTTNAPADHLALNLQVVARKLRALAVVADDAARSVAAGGCSATVDVAAVLHDITTLLGNLPLRDMVLDAAAVDMAAAQAAGTEK